MQWIIFGRLIISSFLFLVGYSMVLADCAFPKFMIRVLKVSLGALFISISSYLLFGERWIYFGILHCIAVSMLLAFPLITRPGLTLIITVILLGCYIMFGNNLPLLPSFRTGKGLDYVPVYPNILFVFSGMLIARQKWHEGWRVIQMPGKDLFIFMGRHALIIYIFHQPVLFLLFYLIGKQVFYTVY